MIVREKKAWKKPALLIHGDVAKITAQVVKPKQLGADDDFGISGISDGPCPP